MRVGGDGNGANLDGPEKAVQELGHVGKQNLNPLFGTHPQATQRVSHLVGVIQQLLVADRLVATLNRRLLAFAFEDVSIHEVGGGIESIGQRGHGNLRCSGVFSARPQLYRGRSCALKAGL